MDYFYDIALDQFVDASGSNRPLRKLAFMRDEDTVMAIRLQNNGAAYTPTGTASLTFGIKQAPGETSTTLAIIEPGDFILAGSVYTGTLNLNGEALSDLLGSDFSLTLYAQLSITDNNGTIKSRVIPVVMSNDIIRGDEVFGNMLPDPDAYVRARAVVYDAAQSLTDPQKAQAQANIGLESLGDMAFKDEVALSDIQDIGSGKLIGRHAGGSGSPQEVGVDGGLEIHGANIRRAALTGDVTASAGSNTTTLANTAVTAGTYTAPTITVDAKGRITASSSVTYETPSGAAAQIAAYKRTELENPQSLARFHDKIQALDTLSLNSYAAITGFGDSMAGNYFVGMIFEEMQDIFGTGGIMSSGFGSNYNGAPTWTLAGGATQPTTEYSYTPSGNILVIPSAATATLVQPAVTGFLNRRSGADNTQAKIGNRNNYVNMPDGVSKVVVYYITEPGAGSLTATLSQSQLADVTSTVDADAALGCGTITLTPGNRAGAMTLELESSTATVRVFGACFYSDRGVIFLSSNAGATTMETQLPGLSGGAWNAAYSGLLSALNVVGVLHAQRVYSPPDTGWQENYESFFAAYEALDLSQFVISEPPMASEGSPSSSETRDFLRLECRERGIGFFDTSAILTAALITELGWGASDPVHNELDCNRYIAGQFLNAVGHFRGARSPYGTAGAVNTYGLAAERFRLLALDDMRTVRVCGHTGRTTETATTSGGWTAPSVNNERGFRFPSAASLGGSAARIGILAGGTTNLVTNLEDFSISGKGYRNINIKAGVQGFIAFGGSGTNIATLVGLTQRVFGLHFALGSDVGSPDGVTGDVVRMFICDTSTVTYSPWIRVAQSGEGVSSTTGWAFTWRWSVSRRTHFLYAGTNAPSQINSPQLRMTLADTALFTAGATTGHWIHGGVYADDGANIPATTGELSFIEFSTRFGFICPPYNS